VNLRGYWGDLVGLFVSRREEKMRRGSGGVHLLLAIFYFLKKKFPEIFVKWRFFFQIGMKNRKIAILYTKFPLQEAKI
jgi:hypothetical protein